MQTKTRTPSTRRICKLTFWRFKVLIFEWLRDADFTDPRSHSEHVFIKNFILMNVPDFQFTFHNEVGREL